MRLTQTQERQQWTKISAAELHPVITITVISTNMKTEHKLQYHNNKTYDINN